MSSTLRNKCGADLFVVVRFLPNLLDANELGPALIVFNNKPFWTEWFLITMTFYKILTAITLGIFISLNSYSQVYRTEDKRFSVLIQEFKESNKISLSINLHQSDFKPWLTKFWDDKSKSWCYTGKEYNFKFFLWPIRNSKNVITHFDLSVFYYGNGYDKMFTRREFTDTYYFDK